jgi:hypothetical protein
MGARIEESTQIPTAAGETTSSGTVDDLEPVVVDYTTRAGAERLAAEIRQYWSGLGYNQVRVWVDRGLDGGSVVRSNLARGLPPPAIT